MDPITSKERKEEVEKNLVLVGQKKAVLIGLKHPQINTDIKGLILRMKKQLMDLRGFSEDNITLMIEDEEPSCFQPTEYNIEIALCGLVYYAHPDDILFIYLIGHGCKPCMILTADKQCLSDSLFSRLINNRHCTLTIVSDHQIEPAGKPMCCSLSPKVRWDTWNKELIRQILKRDQGFIKMGCFCNSRNRSLVDILKDDEKNEDVKSLDQAQDDSETPFWEIPTESSISHPITHATWLTFDTPRVFFPQEAASSTTTYPPSVAHTLYGGGTNVILDIIEETHGQVTNLELAQKAVEKLKMQGIHIKPGLSCNDHQHAYDSFVC